MKPVKYILINETDAQTAARAVSGCKLPDIGQHLLVTSPVSLAELVRLRSHHPAAKILGIC